MNEVRERSPTDAGDSGGGDSWGTGVKLGLAVALGVALGGDLIIEQYDHFGIDSSFAFYSWYGFGVSLVGIGATWIVGSLLGRGDDFYER